MACRDSVFVDDAVLKKYYSQPGSRLQKCFSVLNSCFRCVSLIFFGSNQSNAICFCQNRDLISDNDLLSSLCPRKFV